MTGHKSGHLCVFWPHFCVLLMLRFARADVSRLTQAFCSFFTCFFRHCLRSLPTACSGMAGPKSQLRTWSGLWSWERIKCEGADLRGADPPVTPGKLPLLSALILLRGALLRLLVNFAKAPHRHLVVDGQQNDFRQAEFHSDQVHPDENISCNC